MRTLIIDNYDSFTWNLAQLVGQASGVEPLIVHHDTHDWPGLQALGPFDAIIISPGPGSVHHARDFGVCLSAILQSDLPLLGVCLGHQGIAHAYGGQISISDKPMHGRRSQIFHSGDILFSGIPQGFEAVRYHSQLVTGALPTYLAPIATSAQGELMALRHRSRPQWGVQFHPESILTEYGDQLMRNFRDCVRAHHGPRLVGLAPTTTQPPGNTTQRRKRRLRWHSLHTPLTAEDLFMGLFAPSAQTFWLDSAQPTPGHARFSFMGEADQAALTCRAQDRAGTQMLLDTLEHTLATDIEGADALPFAFHGGWVGYFAYEMKAAFEGNSAHQNPYPDAAWMHVERFIAIDHETQRLYLLALDDESDANGAQNWLTHTAERISALAPAPAAQSQPHTPAASQWDQSDAQYLAAIAQCQRLLRAGESYEICLTNHLRTHCQIDGLALYRRLRRHNPAPYGAYLRLAGIEVASASPERFLHVTQGGHIETKPIKGTSRRDPDPTRDAALAEALQQSEKNRAENLMIVDLLRNDLSRVAVRGSVQVPSLMHIESYATVHQLVSTVTAQLRPECSLIDLLRACFPGGSITGAPKVRTMQWIDALEPRARGVYCGSIGYLGHGRVADLNIAIRTLVATPTEISLGAGGAITVLSQPQDELEEIHLKARALIEALQAQLPSAKIAQPRLTEQS
ncbi:MAG TPA: aminodeoxychorismate synthase component I, partial [Burkholderiaceae bacterium]|nr:aminodeoxychorismate synthase component I [Burkholderiaceae bacterium]